MKVSRDWVTDSREALILSRATCVVAGSGLIVAVFISLAALVRGRPFDPAVWLLIPGAPAVFLGQAWGIAVLTARRPPVSGGARRFFFDGLPKLRARVLLAIAALAWISTMVALAGLRDGVPDGGSPACPYRLNNHGSVTCVSRAVYEHTGASEQRLAASVLAGFFVMQFGIAAAELTRRRVGLPPDSEQRDSLDLTGSLGRSTLKGRDDA